MYWLAKLCKNANCNLIGHTGCRYDCMIKDTYTIINYQLPISHITCTKNVWKPKMINQKVILLFCISNRKYNDN